MAPATRTITRTSKNEDRGVNERLRSVEESLAQVTRALQEITTMNLGMTGNGRNQNQQQFTRMTKVEFPKFLGDDVKGWIFRCEQFFSIDEIPKNRKVTLISVHLFDTALLWHRQFIRINGENVSWNVYKSGILQRFGTVCDDPISEIRKIKYQTNAKEYQDAFDILLSRVDINEEHAVSFYLGGLPAEIEMGVKEVISKPPLLSVPAPNKNLEVLSKHSANTPVNAPARKQLTQKEYQERRAQNLCFYCDKKYTPGHKCAGQLFSLVLVPDDEDCFEDCVDELEENRNSIGIRDLQPQISLNALIGTNNFQTMRVIGTVGKHLVHILVDCGSTYNFLDKNMAKKLGCSIRPTGPLAVIVADGNNFGDIKCNFKELRMEFKYEGKKVQLKGTHKSNLVLMSDKKSKKNARQVVQGEFHSMALSVYPMNVISCSNLEGMPMEVDEQIKAVLKNYEDVFGIPVELPPQRSHDHRIPLVEGALPVNIRPYKHPPTQKDAIESMVKELLEAGVIKKSHSPFASPIVMVKKKYNSWIMCVDYRQLNKQTVKDKFPIPIIEELIDELHGSKYFTKLDLRSSYHQIRMNEADVAKTTFRTHEGHYEFLVMPFGLTNAPSTFQSLMNEVFKPYLGKFTLVFFDDILIYSQCLEEHIRHLQIILETMRTHKLFAKLSKCVFGTIQVEYLGHVISAQGVATDPAKIEAMANCPVPVSLKQLRGFLGLTDYYRRFIKGFAMISRSLTQLLKKEAYEWNSAAQSAFEYLKQAMISASVLKLLDFTKEFTIETDA
ncbi:putative mitochondrial protein [Tanacetum coccineum]